MTSALATRCGATSRKAKVLFEAASSTVTITAAGRSMAAWARCRSSSRAVAGRVDGLVTGHRSRTVRLRSHEPRDLQLRAVGADVVLSALQAELRVEVAGRLVEGLIAYTRVWVRGADARWRVVGGHESAVA